MADKFQLIARVLGKNEKAGEKGVRVHLELEEANGSKSAWISFDPSEVKDIVAGNTYEFMVSRPPKKGGGEPYRNIESVVGPTDLASGGSSQSNGAGGPGRVEARMSAEELRSVERRAALDTVVKLMAQGVSLDDMDPTLEEVFVAAGHVEAYYSHSGGMNGPEGQRPPVTAPPVAGGASPDPEAPGGLKLENPGHLMTAVMDRFGKKSADVCSALGIAELADIQNLQAAWVALCEAWS